MVSIFLEGSSGGDAPPILHYCTVRGQTVFHSGLYGTCLIGNILFHGIITW